VSRAGYMSYCSNVIPTAIPSFLSCTLFGCKNFVWPGGGGGVRPGADSRYAEDWLHWPVDGLARKSLGLFFSVLIELPLTGVLARGLWYFSRWCVFLLCVPNISLDHYRGMFTFYEYFVFISHFLVYILMFWLNIFCLTVLGTSNISSYTYYGALKIKLCHYMRFILYT
jgi:hypothetical protein